MIVDRRPGVDWLPRAVRDPRGTAPCPRRRGRRAERGGRARRHARSRDAGPRMETAPDRGCCRRRRPVLRRGESRAGAAPTLRPGRARPGGHVARRRPVGDAWAWGRKGTDGDVTPLVAATFARYGTSSTSRSMRVTCSSTRSLEWHCRHHGDGACRALCSCIRANVSTRSTPASGVCRARLQRPQEQRLLVRDGRTCSTETVSEHETSWKETAMKVGARSERRLELLSRLSRTYGLSARTPNRKGL